MVPGTEESGLVEEFWIFGKRVFGEAPTRGVLTGVSKNSKKPRACGSVC